MAVKGAFNVLAAQIGICVLLTVFGINHLFADIKVPNEFSSGSPAKASEVNENFAALVEDIQAITEPEKKYSIISSETLDSGLVRTKLYAFEKITYEILYRYDDKTGIGGALELNRDLKGEGVNALGRFEFSGYSLQKLLTDYSPGQWGSSADDILYAPVTCPDGSQIPRHPNPYFSTRVFRNATGGFVLSSHDSTSTGIFVGCSELAAEREQSRVTYWHLEGRGTGIYSCVSRVAYYGVAGGVKYAQAPANASVEVPFGMVATSAREENSAWGVPVLEIDAPADCLQL